MNNPTLANKLTFIGMAVVLAILICLATCNTAPAQQPVRMNPKTGIYEMIKKSPKGDKRTDKVVIIQGKQYPIYEGAKGKTFVWRTSKKGIEYKQYIKVG